jgi:quercetin dioxygenase-like cupin family protein
MQNKLKGLLSKSKYSINRHSGEYQNPVKTIVCWMLVFTSMTMKILDQRFLKKSLMMIAVLFTSSVSNVHAHDAAAKMSREIIAGELLSNIPGHQLTAVTVTIAPGVASPSHRHAGFVFIYVLDGIVESQLNNGEIMTFKAGQSWVEPPGTLHSHAKNPSDSKPAKILAVFVAKENAQLTTMEMENQR